MHSIKLFRIGSLINSKYATFVGKVQQYSVEFNKVKRPFFSSTKSASFSDYTCKGCRSGSTYLIRPFLHRQLRKERSVPIYNLGLQCARAFHNIGKHQSNKALSLGVLANKRKTGLPIAPLIFALSGIPIGIYQLCSNDKNNFIADVVEKSAPAVVFLEMKGRHPLTGKSMTLSNGSGFIVRSHGIVLTNAHVVANSPVVSVKLNDGRVFDGQVTAVDPISDLATVKIPGVNFPTIELGQSSSIRPGEWVIAMGSPLSLSNTVTCGIVSSVQRASKELGLSNKDMDYIQTDAVINFGNSGGPLVDLEGRAIGINTMKVTTGISFAIPSDYAIRFLHKAESLMEKGQKLNGFLKRRFMGITMLTLTKSVMRDLKNNVNVPSFPDVDGGVFVYKVIPGTPAHISGILAGDIIIEICQKPIKSAADVYDAVEKSEILEVTVIRGQHKKTITVNTQETI